jgi:hypothetical protein
MINILRKKEIVRLRKPWRRQQIYKVRQAMIYLMEKVVSAELMPEFTEAV